MLDLSSLTVLATLLFGLVVGQSVFNGDTVHLRISVSPDIVKTGFNEAVAEDIFTATAADLTSGESLIALPRMRVHTQPGLASTMAKWMSLSGIVNATQTTLGIDTMTVMAAVMQGSVPAEATPKAAGTSTTGTDSTGAVKPSTGASKSCLEIALVVTHPDTGIEQNRISQCDSADPIGLVQQGAAWAIERIAPYRVVLAEVLKVARGDDGNLAKAKTTAQRVLARSWDLAQASERAMTYNLLAMMSLAEKDPVAADHWLREALEVPEVLPRIRRVILLNQAMIATVRKQPAEAHALMKQAMEGGHSIDLPDFATNYLIMQALIAWSSGDTATAEGVLRNAERVSRKNRGTHYYLSKLLALKGDTEGATREANAADAARRFEPALQSLVVTLFWIDPVNGTVEWRK